MKKYEKEVLQAQLDNEKAVLGKLEQTYQDALDEINGKIAQLLGRQDADLPHVIYQVQYQQMLKTQVQAILEQLQVNEFETVSDYLTHSYEEGFLGAMYSMQSQGVPFIFPINQERVAAAIQHETKLTSPLYKELGHDIKDLSKKIAGEISRGISTGAMYSDIARDIAGYTRIPLNRAMTITRTEAHRIQTRAAMDACEDAKASGADVVKQWDATLDGNTRPSHRKCDGEIRELDEKFSNGLMYPGEPGGRAGEVINCRCALLQRARWALNRTETKYLGNMDNMTDEELQPLADKLHMPVDELRTYQGQIVPINATSYDDFKAQYSKLSNYKGSQAEADAEARIAGYKKPVRSSGQKMKDADTQMTLEQTVKITEKVYSSDYGIVDRKLVNSVAYHDKFEGLTEHKPVNEAIYQESMRMLEHRDGTPYEDLVVIDARTGKTVESITDSNVFGKVTLTTERYEKIIGYSGNIVLLHNHPNSSRVSYADILALKGNNVVAVVAVGHDGSVNIVSELNKEFDIESFWEEAYNGYKEIYQDNILAEHYATNDLYKLGIFKVESR